MNQRLRLASGFHFTRPSANGRDGRTPRHTRKTRLAAECSLLCSGRRPGAGVVRPRRRPGPIGARPVEPTALPLAQPIFGAPCVVPERPAIAPFKGAFFGGVSATYPGPIVRRPRPCRRSRRGSRCAACQAGDRCPHPQASPSARFMPHHQPAPRLSFLMAHKDKEKVTPAPHCPPPDHSPSARRLSGRSTEGGSRLVDASRCQEAHQSPRQRISKTSSQESMDPPTPSSPDVARFAGISMKAPEMSPSARRLSHHG
mmetsp:Transcript_89518/g.258221  ORF Transcript_89518/g.258221 Transcript_89518/m.258221 type:complete len:257 (+) Transcript_89518:2057-2827(+)